MMKASDLPSILIVDDEGESVPNQLVAGKINKLSLFERIKMELGGDAEYCLHTAENVADAFKVIQSHPVDLVLLDQNIPLEPGQEPTPKGGLDALRRIKKSDDERLRAIETLIMTGHSNEENIGEALDRLDAFGYLSKPLDYAMLRFQVKRAIERRMDRKKIQALTEKALAKTFVVGTSAAMQQVYAMIKKVSLAESSILITGESGVGKELVARAIHGNSRREKKPFVAVDCASIPANLIESELFGHAKGAFTNAVTNKEGLFEQAEGGTIFLDEIGELPLDMQTKLLRVLQEKELKRLGETKVRKIDVRTLAATNRRLEQMVQDGQFRSDLFYRLNVINLHIPPLRERREDIRNLSSYFLKKYADLSGKEISGFSDESRRLIEEYPWPGNVRELENCVERATVLASGSQIRAEDLPAALTLKDVPPREAEHASGSPVFDLLRPADDSLAGPPFQPLPETEAPEDSPWKNIRLRKEQAAGLNYLLKNGTITRQDYMRETGAKPDTAKEHLRDLAEKGLILLKGEKRGAHYILNPNRDQD